MMDRHEEDSHYVKRVVLPSGKTIEVVYFSEADAPANDPVAGERVAGEPVGGDPVAEPRQELHLCIECASELVYPVQWDEAGEENWTVLLHCPNCDMYREGIFCQDTVELFDEELDRGADALARDYKRLMRANMADEIESFVGALAAEAVLPEDF